MAFTGLVLAVLISADRPEPGTVEAARFIGGTANRAFLACACLLLLGLAWHRRQWRDFGLALTTLAALTVVVQVTKLLWVAPLSLRPNGSPGGFPSGHTASSFALAYLLSRSMPRLSPVWYLIAVVVSWSRVAAHAHWPFQVLISAPLGLATALYLDSRMTRDSAVATEEERKAAA